MEKELQDRLRGLQLRLLTQDIYAKNAVCDELLDILKEQDDAHVKNEIRRIIVLPLVDPGRSDDLMACVDALLAQHDYELNIVALMAKEHYLRHLNDLQCVLALHNQEIQLTEQYGREDMLAEAYLRRGKVYLELNRIDEALKDFNNADQGDRNFHTLTIHQ